MLNSMKVANKLSSTTQLIDILNQLLSPRKQFLAATDHNAINHLLIYNNNNGFPSRTHIEKHSKLEIFEPP